MSSGLDWRRAPAAEFAVLGQPIAHSLSPRMHEAAYRALGLQYRYVAIEVPEPEFDEAVASLMASGYRGVNVTVPLKEAAFRWARSTDSFSQRVRAVNTLDLLDGRGINTDGDGFLDALAEAGRKEPGVALLLGAGGSARAVAAKLVETGWTLRIWNRTRERAEELVHQLQIVASIVDEPDPTDADLIVNATSAGLAQDAVQVDWCLAAAGALAFDLGYGLASTPFLYSASQMGIATTDGTRMLVAQGARSLEWWLGVSAPRATMLEALR